MNQHPDEVVLKSPPSSVPSALLMILVAIFAGGQLLLNWDRYTAPGHAFMLLGVMVAAGVAVDALQRKYKVRRNSVSIRILFLWFKRNLPDSVVLEKDQSGSITFSSHEDRKVIATLPRGYGRRQGVVEQLRALYE